MHARTLAHAHVRMSARTRTRAPHRIGANLVEVHVAAAQRLRELRRHALAAGARCRSLPAGGARAKLLPPRLRLRRRASHERCHRR